MYRKQVNSACHVVVSEQLFIIIIIITVLNGL